VSSRLRVVLFLLFPAASFLLSISLGAVPVPVAQTARILAAAVSGAGDPGIPGNLYDVVIGIRVPRVFLGMLVGASLAVSGLIFQALLRNPLAEPYTLGISAGASFGAGLAVFLSYIIGAAVKALLPVFAFTGALSTVFLVYFLARTRGRIQVLTMILSGVIVSYLFSSGLVLIMSLLGDRSHEIIYWLMGSLAGYHPRLPLAAAGAVLLMVFTFAFHRDLDLVSLGDERAQSLGVNTDLVRLVLFTTTSLITAVAVSMTGTIGFVGLIIPHSVRLLIGPRHRALIPATVTAGAAFLPLSDTLGRTLPSALFGSGMEVPVGVITALFGSPFFIFLLIRGKKRYLF
jgi:iron complex transport system permease protein